MSRIFISYKRVDKDKVFKIKDQIESALGEKCWIDVEGIESDAVFANKIGAIKSCKAFLLMYSKEHMEITDYENDWAIRELNFALDKKKRILFVNIDGSPLAGELEFIFKYKCRIKQQVVVTSDIAMIKLCAILRTWLNIRFVDPEALTFRINKVEFKMIHVEGGTFTMGATSEIGNPDDNEMPSHVVSLSSYYIGETPVTQALWVEITGNKPSVFKGKQKPVESVSLNDCKEFIKKLNTKTGKNFRLLTEAEWEFAARGGKKSKGYQFAGSNNISEVAWCDKDMYKDSSLSPYCGIHPWYPWYDREEDPKRRFGTQPVKQKNPNELGLYDMSGNVWEWCQDWYADYNESSQTNPTGPSSGHSRVRRGGGWASSAKDCRSTFRGYYTDDNCRQDDLGLRLALSE